MSRSRSRPDFRHEEALHACGHKIVAGLDEVGRGSWAGPIVAAAVVLNTDPQARTCLGDCVDDSKRLSPGQRNAAFQCILQSSSAVGIGWATHHTIDLYGIAVANRMALCRATNNLRTAPDALLIDYLHLPEIPLPQVSLAHGDAISMSIAAASIVAKVIRDRAMTRCHALYPEYGFSTNKGYGTMAHRIALQSLGPCGLHRRSFAPVATWPD